MNDITPITSGTAIAAAPGYDPFAAYGQEAASGGTFLKFNKGEWVTGQNEDEVKLGTRFAANMDELSIGWLRWDNKAVAERRMHLLVSGVRPEPRDALGHLDQELWETDKEGRPLDPWSFTNELPLADPVTGEQLTYAASSKGGIGCIGNLCKAYGRDRHAHADEVPILELGRDSYQHREWGKTYVPVLSIVDWVANGSVPIPAPDGGSEDDPAPIAEKPATEPKAQAAGSKTRF